MTDKPFKTLEEQIEILKQRNLKFKDSENAKYVLMNNSYYGLINRYKEIFSISTQNAEGDFEDDFQGNYFEDLLSIYDFDKNLSSLLYKPVVLVNFNILKNISKFLQNVVVLDLIEHCKPVICFQIYSLAL
ncbi:Abi family protein [Enterococcus faecium]|uniref:Abi family protein n=1 Tax=Enterococcus faecium TaxID=1352 RepID=UPI00338DB744